MSSRQFFFLWFSVYYGKALWALAFVRVQYHSVNAVSKGKGNSALELRILLTTRSHCVGDPVCSTGILIPWDLQLTTEEDQNLIDQQTQKQVTHNHENLLCVFSVEVHPICSCLAAQRMTYLNTFSLCIIL